MAEKPANAGDAAGKNLSKGKKPAGAPATGQPKKK